MIRPIVRRENVRVQYHSLSKNKEDYLDKIFFRTNFPFWLRYLQIIFRGRSLALKGEFTDRKFFEFSAEFIRILESYGGIFHITGIENVLETEGPVVFAGNHMSVLETFVLPAFIASQKPLTFVVKDSLVTNRMFGAIMKSRDPIALARTNPREDFNKVMTEGLEKLKNNRSVAIFPQATRDRIFKRSEFNSIATKLAKKAGVPLVPIALKTDFWLPGGPVKDLGALNRDRKIHFSIGKPIPAEVPSKESQTILEDYIIDHLKYWGGEIAE
ncbi:MAG: 1-acyl-sn-glycerol-3-phosphate acyltransferase [Leptospira sp.]|nr:1-acyl-sn-glycerol-3-phosphate acyltransferase [Leptospira sp.]